MDIARLTEEIEATFRDMTLDQIPAHIAWMEQYIAQLKKHLECNLTRQAAGKKMQRHQMVSIRQYPRMIKDHKLVVRALKEAYAYRIDA